MPVWTRPRRRNHPCRSWLDLGYWYVNFRLHSFNPYLRCGLVTGKDRREKADFIGAAGALEHLKNGPPRRRIGLIVDGAPARGMFSSKGYRNL